MQTQSISLPRSSLFIGFAVLLAFALLITAPVNPDWWQIVVLGIVQGITEWLPISSTAHLLLTSQLLNYQGSIGGTFEIAIQFGTVCSVLLFYWRDLFGQANALIGRGDPETIATARKLWLGVIIAFVPAAAVGIVARDFIKAVLFESPLVIAAALISGGIIFLWIERGSTKRRTSTAVDFATVSNRRALTVGIAQIFALVPGVSRSGASIVGGLLAGFDRPTATAFSFYLAIPTLGAATLVDLIGSLDQIQTADWGRLLLGATVAMIVGYGCIGWLLRYIATHNFTVFGYYRILAGVLIIGAVALGVL
ncbi:undecaprenyl-diphosphate phosphatase [uncultured Chloroflexus sp.]|uniref:undecaprenyl-diphosphate phosphatase n=1 Tax=uncultured Chloroflexus sp. TaxID=214040 RepID=UPI00262140AA|nr:undecaprenyl-diphosphate phosphatase [uncultured Chloroflexus sp.]